MKRLLSMSFLCLIFCLLLAGCAPSSEREPIASPTPSPTATASPAPTSTPEPAPESTPDSTVFDQSRKHGIPLSQIDFAAYEDLLDSQGWEALTNFFPVLIQGEPFLNDGSLWEDSTHELEPIVLSEFFNVLLAEEPGYVPFEYPPASFTLFDCDGDGQQELALRTGYCGGWYIVLKQEGETFYGCYMPERWFGQLQTNGVALSSGGAGNASLNKLRFQDGHFWDEAIASTSYYHLREDDVIHYYIGKESIPENEVSEEEFELWCEETLPGDALWYAAIPKAENPN